MQKITNLITSNTLFTRFIKFGFIGLTGILVNSAVLWFLYTYIEVSILIASPFAIILAIFNNFSWNNRFTWKANRENLKNSYGQRLWKYYLSASLGSFINYMILLILTIGLDLYYLLSNLAGILVGMISNFLLSEFWVFKPHKNQAE